MSILTLITAYCLSGYLNYSLDSNDTVKSMQTRCSNTLQECVRERGDKYCKKVMLSGEYYE